MRSLTLFLLGLICSSALLQSDAAEEQSNQASRFHKQGKLDEAIEKCTTAIRLDPKFALAQYARGVLWAAKGEYDKAIADCNEAIRIDPRNAMAYNNRAWLMVTCPDAEYRNGAKAIEDATRANELSGWDKARRLDTLAAAYAELGKFDEAIEYQEKAIKLESDEDRIKDHRSRLELYKTGKPYRDQPTD